MTSDENYLYIERVDASRKMARFYALSIEPTLFGETSLVRRWGRIGTHGRTKIHQFPETVEALHAFHDLLHRKQKRGYQFVTAAGRKCD